MQNSSHAVGLHSVWAAQWEATAMMCSKIVMGVLLVAVVVLTRLLLHDEVPCSFHGAMNNDRRRMTQRVGLCFNLYSW